MDDKTLSPGEKADNEDNDGEERSSKIKKRQPGAGISAAEGATATAARKMF